MPGDQAFETATRIGFAARGVMYGLIGWLALKSGRTEDGEGVIRYLDSGSGRFVLAAMAVGFFAYGAWRLLHAWHDPERRGADAKGAAVRAGGAFSGLVHLGLGAAALLHALGSGGGGGNGGAASQGASAALDLPGGTVLLLLVAAALLATGLFQLKKAWTLDFMDDLTAGKDQSWLCWLGRAGHAARGLVFALTALLFFRAATQQRSSEAGGIGEALGALPSGLQAAVAAGLLLFGLFSLAEARFRRFSNPIG